MLRLAVVPPCVGLAGWLSGGMDSQPLLEQLTYSYKNLKFDASIGETKRILSNWDSIFF
jgi:hypothetical protein